MVMMVGLLQEVQKRELSLISKEREKWEKRLFVLEKSAEILKIDPKKVLIAQILEEFLTLCEGEDLTEEALIQIRTSFLFLCALLEKEKIEREGGGVGIKSEEKGEVIKIGGKEKGKGGSFLRRFEEKEGTEEENKVSTEEASVKGSSPWDKIADIKEKLTSWNEEGDKENVSVAK